jgi:hypothetical protein
VARDAFRLKLGHVESCGAMVDLSERVVGLVGPHPNVREIRLVGSRAAGQARPASDWDFRVDVDHFGPVASALPDLLRPLEPLAQQWDRLSDEQCWMLILHGPVKVDVIFPHVPHVHEPPWEPSPDNLEPLDAHFWDWTLWLHGKEAGAEYELISKELAKLYDHLLKPLGLRSAPTSVAGAVAAYRTARDDAEERFGQKVPRGLESEVAPAVLRIR